MERGRQPRRPDDHRAAGERSTSGQFRLCQRQSRNEQANGYRRMIFEDERATSADLLGFVLHLGDFIYEVVDPDEVRRGHDRTIYDVGRIPDGGKSSNFHYPLTVDGYRVVYKGYLADPDLQDARARWPFVAIWDNHELSRQGRQSIVQAGGPATGPDGQGRRRPGMVRMTSRAREGAERIARHVRRVGRENVLIEEWDDSGLGIDPTI